MLGYARKPLGLLLFLMFWELISYFGLVSSDYMPRLSTIGSALLKFLNSAEFWESLSATVQRSIISLICAVAIALALAILAGRFPIVRRALGPITDIMRSLPPPALVPLLIFVLGVGPGLFLFVGIYGCIWPTYVSASNALSTAEPVQVNTARSFGLGSWEIMWKIRLPAAMPEIFTGIRLSASISLLAAVASEMLVGGVGLGSLVYNAGFSLLWAEMYALMFTIGILGILINALVAAVRFPLAGWQSRYAALGAQG